MRCVERPLPLSPSAGVCSAASISQETLHGLSSSALACAEGFSMGLHAPGLSCVNSLCRSLADPSAEKTLLQTRVNEQSFLGLAERADVIFNRAYLYPASFFNS